MKPESKFWNNKLKPRIARGDIRGTWQRIEAKLPAGLPDCLVNLDSRTLWVELKSVYVEKDLRTELRPEQALWIYKWNEDGGEAYVLAYIQTTGEMHWYRDTLAIRKGVFKRILVPSGLYGNSFYGGLK